MTRVQGRTALVTGGASGIGQGIAAALAEAGVRVAVADIDLAGAERTAELIRSGTGAEAIAVPLDVRQPAAWGEAADRVERELGPIHILCSNAGVGAGKDPVEARLLEDLDWVWSVNARGMFIGVRELLPRIRKHGQGGHILLTSSMMGVFATSGISLYVMSKYAAVGLAETLFLELKGSNIGVSVLCPGMVNTQLVSNVQKHMPSQQANARNAATTTFIENGADPLDVGRFVTRAIEDDRFYIFTHPEYRDRVQERFELMLEGFDGRATAGQRDDLSFFSPTYRS